MSDIDLPTVEKESAPEADAALLARARVWNLLGLAGLANLGMRLTAPRDLRWFGFGAGFILLVAGGWAFRAGHVTWSASLLALYAALVLAGLVHPRFPEIAGHLWMRLGESMGKVMAYPIFALLYFAAVTPTALALRAFGKDPLNRKAPPAGSYWVKREPSPKARFERQF